LRFFHEALENAKPAVETRRVLMGGKGVPVPIPVAEARAMSLATKFLRDSFRERKDGKYMPQKLVLEILELHKKEGATANRRENLHKTAEANRAFIHFLNRRR